jgi:hypothetical protein
VYFIVTVVVPLPFFHVNFEVRLPVSLLMGTVTLDVAVPAARAAGVQTDNVELVVPVPFVVLMVVDATSFEHATCGVVADADWARGRSTPLPRWR